MSRTLLIAGLVALLPIAAAAQIVQPTGQQTSGVQPSRPAGLSSGGGVRFGGGGNMGATVAFWILSPFAAANSTASTISTLGQNGK